MKWYHVGFDPSWVICRNFKCRAEFIKDKVKTKRKCPSCKMNNYGQITKIKEQS